MSINNVENEKVPLTKPKKNVEQEINNTIGSIDSSTTKPIEPIKLKKPRPPKTAKQMESFKKVQEKRKEILDAQMLNKKIEASKLLLQHNIKPNKPLKEETDDEPEIIYVTKPKKKKHIIIESSSESSSESEEEYIEKVKQKQWGKSQKNKKSVVKINNSQPQNNTIKPSYNFFCD
jgi:hypothetical protein